MGRLPSIPGTSEFERAAKFKNVSDQRVFVHLPTASDTPQTCASLRGEDKETIRRVRKLYGVSWSPSRMNRRLKYALPRSVVASMTHPDDDEALERMVRPFDKDATKTFSHSSGADGLEEKEEEEEEEAGEEEEGGE